MTRSKFVQCVFFKKYLLTKKLKLSSELMDNCTTFDEGILNPHLLLLFKKKNAKKNKKKTKKNLKPLSTGQASSVTLIWKPLVEGSLLAPLMTTYDTWLPPDPP